jgi:pimeloyl-ACP methyl ester carboxylesterase
VSQVIAALQRSFRFRMRLSAPHLAFREWERVVRERFADLKDIRHPTLVVNGIYDEMTPVRNSYWLSANLPNAVLLTYPDSGHDSLFQFHESLQGRPRRFYLRLHRTELKCSMAAEDSLPPSASD